MHAIPDIPLQSSTLLDTYDLDSAQTTVAKVLKKHDMRCLDRTRDHKTRLNCLKLADVSLIYLHYGSNMVVEPGPMHDFHLLHMNLEGECGIQYRSKEIVAASGRTVLCSPSRPTRFRWRPDSRVLAVRIDKQALNQHFQTMTGLPVQREIEFEPELDHSTPQGMRWLSLLNFIDQDSRQPDGLWSSRAGAGQLAGLLMTTLLMGQPGSHQELVNRPLSPAAPRYVKRAEEFMLANIQQPLTLADLADHVGVSPRSLTNGFREFRGASPMAYFTNLRLERAHEELTAARATTTVTDVANRIGFQHLSHFASLYRRRYGIKPCETLRSHRN